MKAKTSIRIGLLILVSIAAISLIMPVWATVTLNAVPPSCKVGGVVAAEIKVAPDQPAIFVDNSGLTIEYWDGTKWVENKAKYDKSISVGPNEKLTTETSDKDPWTPHFKCPEAGTYRLRMKYRQDTTYKEATATFTRAQVCGGIVIQVNKLELISPYVGLISTIVVATFATTIYVKRKSRHR